MCGKTLSDRFTEVESSVSPAAAPHLTPARMHQPEREPRAVEAPGGREIVFGLDPNGCINMWSPGAAAFYGLDAETAIGRSADRLFAEESRAPWPHIAAHALNGECIVNYHARHCNADGATVSLVFDVYPTRNREGAVTGITVAGRGAETERPRCGTNYHSDLWTRAIVETAVDGVLTLDVSGTIQFINPAAERMFGYASTEVVGQAVEKLLPLDYTIGHRHFGDAYRAGRLSGPRMPGRELIGRRRDGTTFPVEISVSEVVQGEHRIFTCILHDITDRRRRQEELNKRNIELTCLYRAGEAMRSFDLLSDLFQEVVSLICPAFTYPEIARCRLTFDGDRYVSSPFSATPWRLATDIVVEGRKRGEVEVFYLEGRPTLEEGPFLREERELVDAITRDIGFTIERREAEVKVIQASKLASIGELAAGVGHEINNPLNGIINCADILASDFAEDTRQRRFADLIRSESERIANIVRNLLTFARQDREHYSPARLCDIVESVLSLSRKKITKSHIHLSVETPEDLPKLCCRSEQLQQVVMNLIINALDALDERYKGMNPDKVLNIVAEPMERLGKQFIRLTVEDHGCGIAPAHAERLFDPFFTTKGRDKGTGLGLSISDAIVRQHGGQITVESELGRYARFLVDLLLEGPRSLSDPDHPAPRT